MNRERIISVAEQYALEHLMDAELSGGDYWGSITVDGVEYDINLYDQETEGREWTLSIYPLRFSEGSGFYETDTMNPIVEGLLIEEDGLN